MEGGWVEVLLGQDGYYYLIVDVNGMLLCFIVDIGVSIIVLGVDDVCWVGIDFVLLGYLG